MKQSFKLFMAIVAVLFFVTNVNAQSNDRCWCKFNTGYATTPDTAKGESMRHTTEGALLWVKQDRASEHNQADNGGCWLRPYDHKFIVRDGKPVRVAHCKNGIDDYKWEESQSPITDSGSGKSGGNVIINDTTIVNVTVIDSSLTVNHIYNDSNSGDGTVQAVERCAQEPAYVDNSFNLSINSSGFGSFYGGSYLAPCQPFPMMMAFNPLFVPPMIMPVWQPVQCSSVQNYHYQQCGGDNITNIYEGDTYINNIFLPDEEEEEEIVEEDFGNGDDEIADEGDFGNGDEEEFGSGGRLSSQLANKQPVLTNKPTVTSARVTKTKKPSSSTAMADKFSNPSTPSVSETKAPVSKQPAADIASKPNGGNTSLATNNKGDRTAQTHTMFDGYETADVLDRKQPGSAMSTRPSHVRDRGNSTSSPAMAHARPVGNKGEGNTSSVRPSGSHQVRPNGSRSNDGRVRSTESIQARGNREMSRPSRTVNNRSVQQNNDRSRNDGRVQRTQPTASRQNRDGRVQRTNYRQQPTGNSNRNMIDRGSRSQQSSRISRSSNSRPSSAVSRPSSSRKRPQSLNRAGSKKHSVSRSGSSSRPSSRGNMSKGGSRPSRKMSHGGGRSGSRPSNRSGR